MNTGLLIGLAATVVYIAVGIASGSIASRIAYAKTKRRSEYQAKMWGWWTLFLWPFVIVGLALFGLGFGLYRVVERVMIPEEVR